MNQSHNYFRPELFSLRNPLRALANAVLLGVFFVLIVFGSYGTMYGGYEVVEFRYWGGTFVAAIAIIGGLLSFECYNNKIIDLYAFRSLEGLLLFTFYFFALIALFVTPYKLTGTLAVSAATVVTVLLVTNRATTLKRFEEVFSFVCLLIYLTSVIALLSGAYTYWVGSFSVGPLWLEYNRLFWRVNSWFITSTAFGVFQAYGIIAAIYLIANSRRWIVRGIHLLTIFCLVVGIFLSGARTPVFGLGFAILIVITTRLSLRKHYVISLCLGAALVYLVVVFLKPYSYDILTFRRIMKEESILNLGRFIIWQTGFDQWRRFELLQMIFGSGFGTFKETLGWSVGAHIGILRILVEHGVLGLGIFFTFMSLSLWRIATAVRSTPRPSPEMKVMLLFFTLFFFDEFFTQNLMGISMDYLLFLVFFGLYLSSRRLRLYRATQGPTDFHF